MEFLDYASALEQYRAITLIGKQRKRIIIQYGHGDEYIIAKEIKK